MKSNINDKKSDKQSPNVMKTLGRLTKYIFKYYKAKSILVLVLILISAVSMAAAAGFLQRIIDNCILPGLENGIDSVTPQLTSYIVEMGVIFAAGVIAAHFMSRIGAVITQGTLYNMRADMFSKMETLPIKYFDTHASGDIMSTYTNDTDAIRQFIGQSFPTLISCAFNIIAILVMMFTSSLWLTIIVLLSCMFMFMLTGKIGGASSKYMIKQQHSLATEEGFIEEMMKGQKVVKVFCHEEENVKNFDKLNEQLYVDSSTANKYGNLLGPVLGNVGNLLYVIIAIGGGLLVYYNVPNIGIGSTGAISIGIIISFLAIVRQLTQAIGQFAMQVPMIAMAGAGAGRVFDLMDQEPEHDDGYVTLVNAIKDSDGNLSETSDYTGLWAWRHFHQADNTVTYTELKGDVRLTDVDFGYTSDKMVLNDVTFYAKPGQKIAFVGATGAGKTTITNLINRFYDIEDGKIRYDGININKIKKPDLRRSLAIVLQDVNLFTGTVMDNIRYGKLNATDEECIAAAKLANAHEFITRLPDGYNTMLTANGSSLSQGQRQLISIARAGVANAPAMILDEATSSIDTHTEALVQDGMDKLMKGRTVFVIAHRLSTVKNSNLIVVLDHGRVIEKGNHEELIANRGTYYQLYSGAFELE